MLPWFTQCEIKVCRSMSQQLPPRLSTQWHLRCKSCVTLTLNSDFSEFSEVPAAVLKTIKLIQRSIKSLYLTPGSKLMVPRSIPTTPNLK